MTTTTILGRVRAAIGDALNALGAEVGLPELGWTHRSYMDGSRINGHAGTGSYSPSEIVAITAAWARHLGLTLRDDMPVGTVDYVGTVDGLSFSVWGVTDPDAFNNTYLRNGAR